MKELYTWYCVCVVKTHDTNDNVTTKTQSTFHTKHMNIDTWSECARSSLVCFFSQVLVVMIAHHIVAQVSLVRVISWSSHDERISSTLSPPFPSTSSSSHSSLTSCTSSCTSSTALRAVATLRTSPERRWTQLTNPTSSQITDATREGCQGLLDAVWPPQVRAQGAGHRTHDRTSLSRGRGVCPTERVPQGHECQRARPGFKKHRRPCPRVALLWWSTVRSRHHIAQCSQLPRRSPPARSWPRRGCLVAGALGQGDSVSGTCFFRLLQARGSRHRDGRKMERGGSEAWPVGGSSSW